MRIGSLFSGIGGLDLGLESAGLGPVAWQVEADPFCRRVLRKHWPHVTKYTNVKALDLRELAPVDLVCGGFPCQDVSSAGKGAGLDGERSGLWYEFRRIVEGLKPPTVVVENVASGKARWLSAVRSQLCELGYATWPLEVWASDVGAPHRRARVFVVALAYRNRRGRDKGSASASRGTHAIGRGETLAHGDGRGRPRVGLAGSDQRQSSPPGIDVDGCDLPSTWPPPPNDVQAWGALSVTTQPALCRITYGFSNRMDRDRLKALGNAVVPQCAREVGWWLRRKLEGQGNG